MGRMGNTFGSQSVNAGHARKVWREVKDQFPAGGVVTNLTDWVSAGVGKIPAGTFCKWYDDADNGGKKVVCYTAAQIKAASGNPASLGINGATLYDIDIENGDTVGTATVVYAGEYYDYMVKDSSVLSIVKGLASLSEIKFVS
jgi:hypothetical protein